MGGSADPLSNSAEPVAGSADPTGGSEMCVRGSELDKAQSNAALALLLHCLTLVRHWYHTSTPLLLRCCCAAIALLLLQCRYNGAATALRLPHLDCIGIALGL